MSLPSPSSVASPAKRARKESTDDWGSKPYGGGAMREVIVQPSVEEERVPTYGEVRKTSVFIILYHFPNLSPFQVKGYRNGTDVWTLMYSCQLPKEITDECTETRLRTQSE